MSYAEQTAFVDFVIREFGWEKFGLFATNHKKLHLSSTAMSNWRRWATDM